MTATTKPCATHTNTYIEQRKHEHIVTRGLSPLSNTEKKRCEQRAHSVHSIPFYYYYYFSNFRVLSSTQETNSLKLGFCGNALHPVIFISYCGFACGMDAFWRALLAVHYVWALFGCDSRCMQFLYFVQQIIKVIRCEMGSPSTTWIQCYIPLFCF